MQRVLSVDEGMADAVVVGGGLAGLAAAAELARAGLRVVLLEKSNHAGGRAITQRFEDGFRFNLGPHALYRKGAAQSVLRQLGVKWTGGLPPQRGGRLIYRGETFIAPLGTLPLLLTGLLSFSEKLAVAQLLSSLGRIDADALDGVTLAEWLKSVSESERVRQLMATIVRVTTYTSDAERLSAGAALKQVRLGFEGNVDYLDDGWQTLVDGALQVARESGVRVVTQASVLKIRRGGSGYTLRLRSGETYRASSVVLAVAPQAALAMVEGGEESIISEWAKDALPVRAACLDVALKRLPRAGKNLFALGVDRPLYCIVHSASARLAPEGGALIHAMKAHSTGEEREEREDRKELEGMLDLLHPGWRALVEHERFLPRITVSNAVVTAQQGGLKGRPGPSVPGFDNLYVAGDWVGDEGMLLDASLASAHHAAQLVMKRHREAPRELLIA